MTEQRIEREEDLAARMIAQAVVDGQAPLALRCWAAEIKPAFLAGLSVAEIAFCLSGSHGLVNAVLRSDCARSGQEKAAGAWAIPAA